MSAVGGNYVSDGAIMAWLASQQDRLYADLRESMDIAERRADFTSALVDVKTQLQQANTERSFGKVDAELQALLTEYGSDPEFAEICAALRPMADRIHADWAYASGGYDAAVEKYWADIAAYQKAGEAVQEAFESSVQGGSDIGAALASGAVQVLKPEWPADPVLGYSDDDIKIWTQQIDGKLDVSGKNDQLTMIHIQELKGTIDQGSQLGSTLVASGDKTIDRIIGNFT